MILTPQNLPFSDLKNVIANLVLVQPVCQEFLKNRNTFSRKGAGGVKGRLEFFQKIICFGEYWHPFAQP